MSGEDQSKPKKPTGITGPVYVSFEGVRPTSTFMPFDFPTSKDEVESVVAQGFLTVAVRQSLLSFAVNRLAKNPTDDYDFTLHTSAGLRYLELLEVAPQPHMSAGYQNAPSSYRPYEFAQTILESIMAKSCRYDPATASLTTVLLYETHWPFAPSAETLALLQYFVFQRSPRFHEIYWYHPIARDDGIVEFVYPTPAEHWGGFDPETWQDAVVHNLDPRGWNAGKD